MKTSTTIYLNKSMNLICFMVFFFLFLSQSSNAQTTSIPDINFEQELINRGIDSDATINGHVLTSDIDTVVNLNLSNVHDLTGLQDFAALESLELDQGGAGFGAGLTVNLTTNTNLKKVEIQSFEGLSALDLTGLTSLEELILRESQGDVMTMQIDSLDLSTNTNIHKISLGAMFLMQVINLQNGNNANMVGVELSLAQDGQGLPMPDRPMCIKVDDATAAMANIAPYDSWIVNGIAPTFYDTGQCVLSINHVETVEVALYPNPVQTEFHLKSPAAIKGIDVFSLQGKKVAHFPSSQERYDVSALQTGMYFLKIATPTGIQIMRFVKQ